MCNLVVFFIYWKLHAVFTVSVGIEPVIFLVFLSDS